MQHSRVPWILVVISAVALTVLVLANLYIFARNSKKGILYKFADFLTDYWTDILLLVLPLAIIAFQYFFTDEAIKYWTSNPDIKASDPTYVKILFWSTVGIFGGVAATVIVATFHFYKQYRISKLKDELRDLGIERAQAINDLNALIKGFLVEIANHLNFGNDDRLTLYVHEKNLKYFDPIGRFSQNPVFNTYNRQTYPDNEGFIGLAWNNGAWYAANLPEYTGTLTSKNSYLRATGQGKIPMGTFDVIRMKSRLYYGYRISNTAATVQLAVLMIESMNPIRWTQGELDAYFKKENNKLCNILERTQSRIPEFSDARERGY